MNALISISVEIPPDVATSDVEIAAAELVARLRDAGCFVHSATCVSGWDADLKRIAAKIKPAEPAAIPPGPEQPHPSCEF